MTTIIKKIPLIALSVVLMTSCNSGKNIQKPDTGMIGTKIASSKQTTNWTGCYHALTPCADCEGIELQIELFADNTYKMSRTFSGKDAASLHNAGAFTWNKTETQIDLKSVNEGGAYEHYIVQDGKLILLDSEGNIPITTDMNLYTLKKVDNKEAQLIDSKLSNKYWKLVELNGTPVKASDGLKEAQLTFKLNGEVFGNLSCNAYHATYKLETGNRIRISEGVSTKMMCMQMEVENGLAKALNTVDNYNVSDSVLILNRARMAPLAKFEAVWMN
jgi:heat shock protein HslJ